MLTRASARLAQKKDKAVQSDDDEAHGNLILDTNHGGYYTPHIERHGTRDPTTDLDRPGSEEQSPQKRRRATAKQGKRNSGKDIRRKEGRLSGLAHMPLEIFTEIMSHLMPADALALSRTNKLFRNLLKNRSSVHIWHATMDNVPGLPPCPEGMSEPSYLSVLFSKICTLCGNTEKEGLDKVLLVRLCAPCRRTSLINLKDVPSELAPFIHVAQSITQRYQPPSSRNKYVLAESLAKLQVEYEKVLQSGNKSELEDWKREKKRAVAQRNEDGRVLAQALRSHEHHEWEVMNKIGNVRRAEIERRLEELGWTKEDRTLNVSEDRIEYDALAGRPEPLTEDIWASIKPKLISLLEAHRFQRAEKQRLNLMEKRRRRLWRLCLDIQEQITPELEIRVWRPNPVPPNQNSLATIRFGSPFPSLPCLLSWPFLKKLHETDSTVEDMEIYFKADRDEIEDCIANWQSSVETHFLDQLRQGLAIRVEPLDTTNILPYRGRPFYDLSEEEELLLRADSLFYYKDSESSPTGHTRPETYHSILVVHGLIGPPDRYAKPFLHDLLSTPKLDQFLVYPEAQEVARTLLVSIRRRNASFLEMNAIGDRFGCGRCHKVGMYWNDVVHHYVRHKNLYPKVREELLQLGNDGIIYNNIHNAEMQPTRPMIKFCLAPDIGYAEVELEVCQLCQKIQVIRGTVALSKPEMIQHLLDVHDVTEPEVEKHYVTHTLPNMASCDEYGFPIYNRPKARSG